MDQFSQLLSITYEIYLRSDCNAKSFVKGSFVDMKIIQFVHMKRLIKPDIRFNFEAANILHKW